jgi:large subunit ribosomal protein L7/L12
MQMAPSRTTTDQVIEAIEAMSVLELVEFQQQLAERWGVKVTPVQGQFEVLPGSITQDYVPVFEEPSSFDVLLQGAGSNKIATIKVLRQLIPGLGLVDAKELAESGVGLERGAYVLLGVSKDDARLAADKLVEAGARVAVMVSGATG